MRKISLLRKFNFLLMLFALCSVVFLQDAFADNYYWENPERITRVDSRFPKAISNDFASAIFWQEIDAKNSAVYLSCSIKTKNSSWQAYNRFAGPFPYSGEVPDLYSAAMNVNGKICVSALSDPNMVSVFETDDYGKTFTRRIEITEFKKF